MLYRNLTIEENIPDAIINQLSDEPDGVSDEYNDLYFDDKRNYLFVDESDVREYDGKLQMHIHIHHPISHCTIKDILNSRDTLVFVMCEGRVKPNYYRFMGVYKLALTYTNLCPDNSYVVLELASENADVDLRILKPNFRLICTDCYDDTHKLEHNYFCSIEQEAKSMAYDEVKKMPLDDGEYYTDLYRILPNGSLDDISGMPSMDVKVRNGKVQVDSPNPFV